MGMMGFTQLLLVGGMVFNVGDIFGLRRIWGGRGDNGRAEIRIGGFFGGGILWILMIVVGLGKYVVVTAELIVERCYRCIGL
jgi:hypothetical protein